MNSPSWLIITKLLFSVRYILTMLFLPDGTGKGTHSFGTRGGKENSS